mmetsp:Transcript_4807/g.19774  ORF Transcript_4807/g.19774 Transcript_4807/m.19774 type:complete len:229 (-) Transcript_4807:146-832(-)
MKLPETPVAEPALARGGNDPRPKNDPLGPPPPPRSSSSLPRSPCRLVTATLIPRDSSACVRTELRPAASMATSSASGVVTRYPSTTSLTMPRSTRPSSTCLLDPRTSTTRTPSDCSSATSWTMPCRMSLATKTSPGMTTTMTLPWWLTMYGDACRKNSTNLSAPMPSRSPGLGDLLSSHDTIAAGRRPSAARATRARRVSRRDSRAIPVGASARRGPPPLRGAARDEG